MSKIALERGKTNAQEILTDLSCLVQCESNLKKQVLGSKIQFEV